MTGARFWVGGYTASMEGTATGIGVTQQRGDGTLEYVGVAAVIPSPSFLASANALVYAVDESNSRVEIFRPSGGGALDHLGGAATSGGYPCHLSVTRQRLYVSNYGSGTVDVFGLDDDGALGALLQTFDGLGATPHAHSTLIAGSTVLSADLGDDRVHLHRLSDGLLERTGSASLPGGTGPRDLLRSRDGLTYVLGELSGALFTIDDRGRILHTGSVVADWVGGDHAAALALDSSGRYLYTALRGSNRIAVVDALTLAPIAAIDCSGSWPRHLVVSGGTLHVANERSSTISTFRINRGTGIPTLVGEPRPVPTPTFLLKIQESGRR